MNSDNKTTTPENGEIRYQTIFENANDAIFLIKKDKFIECNPKTLEMYGVQKEQIISHSPHEFSPLKQPDGRNSKEKALEFINKTLAGEPQRFEWKHIKYDGTKFDAKVSLNKIMLGGKPYIIAIVRDITEEKRAKENLKTSEMKFRELFESSQDGIFIHDLDGNISDVNPKIINQLGYSKDEILSKKTSDLYPESAQESLTNALNVVIRDKFVKFETEFIKKDGSLIQVEVSMNILEIMGKRMIQGIIRNISESKKVETTLKQSEEKLKLQIKKLDILNKIILAGAKADNLIDLLNIILQKSLEFIDFDGGGIYIIDNGKKIAELQTSQNLPNKLVEQVKSIPVDTKPFSRVLLEKESIFTSELSSIRPETTNNFGFNSLISIPLLTESKVIGVFNLVSFKKYDLTDDEKNTLKTIGYQLGLYIEKIKTETAIKQSEEKFRNLAKLLPLIIFEINSKGKITYLNKCGFNIFGYSEDELSQGLFINQIIESQELKRLDQDIQKALEGKDLKNYKYTAIRKNGEKFPILIYSCKIGKTEKTKGIRGAIVDISEQKKSEAALKEKIDELERMTKLMVGRELRMIELKKKLDEIQEKK